MKRRAFLKLIGVASLAPSVLAAPIPFKLNEVQRRIITDYDGATKTVAIALEDIPKGQYGWVVLVQQKDMPDNEVLLKFPKGQGHKNIRIVNIGVEEGEPK